MELTKEMASTTVFPAAIKNNGLDVRNVSNGQALCGKTISLAFSLPVMPDLHVFGLKQIIAFRTAYSRA